MNILNKDKLVLIFFTYPIGFILGIFLNIFKLLGRIKIENANRLLHRYGNLMVVSNHPSLLEPFLLIPLFFRDYIFHPIKYGPWSAPDPDGFCHPLFWKLLGPKIIPIRRSDGEKKKNAASTMIKVLRNGGILIVHAEGGRTEKGTIFFFSRQGKKIRELEKGIGVLAARTRPTIQVIWVEGTDKMLPNTQKFQVNLKEKITIKIGVPFNTNNEKPQEITERITQELLNLADE